MDRTILEGDPHAVLEGMLIGSYAIGASEGFIYVRNEYPLAIEILEHAIDEAEKRGLLGENIFGSGWSFHVTLRRGAGAYICGEETALIESLEGHSGEPRTRPPYPVTHGLWGKPTVVNNVKTWASVPPILTRGADWYAAMGTKRTPGTTIFSLEGAVKNAGLVEVPFGMTLREVVYDIGGGVSGDRPLKALQAGGASRGCIPPSMLDLAIDTEDRAGATIIIGTGGIIVLDDTACMVDMARFLVGFFLEESCGKCVPCREGTQADVPDLVANLRGPRHRCRSAALGAAGHDDKIGGGVRHGGHGARRRAGDTGAFPRRVRDARVSPRVPGRRVRNDARHSLLPAGKQCRIEVRIDHEHNRIRIKFWSTSTAARRRCRGGRRSSTPRAAWACRSPRCATIADCRRTALAACAWSRSKRPAGASWWPRAATRSTNRLMVHTETERVKESRRTVLELLLAQAPDSRELAEFAAGLGVEATPFQATPGKKCILCGLCTRVCNEMMGRGAINLFGRGHAREVRPAYDEQTQQCQACGACAVVCPTGAVDLTRSPRGGCSHTSRRSTSI